MHGNEFWTYWLQVLGGLVLAVLMRYALRQPVVPRRLLGAYRYLHSPLLYVQHRLFPSGYEDGAREFRNFITAAFVFLAMFMYRVRLSDPAHALSEPFSNGILISAALVAVSLLFLEVLFYYMGIIDQPADCTLRTSRNVATGVVAVLVMLLDLLTFEHGHWIALFLVAGLLVVWLVAVVFTYVL